MSSTPPHTPVGAGDPQPSPASTGPLDRGTGGFGRPDPFPSSAVNPPTPREGAPHGVPSGDVWPSVTGAPPVSPPSGGGWDAGGDRPRPRRRRVGVAFAAGVLAAALVGGTAGAAVNEWTGDDTAPAASTLSGSPLSQSELEKAPSGSVQEVAQAVLPSVVSIAVRTGQGSGSGSGVILSSDGQILTNNHVVAGAADGGEITVRFNDDRTATAHIVGRDETSDLAVIQAEDVKDLKPATLGRSSGLQVGEEVVAIGSPLGLSGTVTTGIVSAMNRPVSAGSENADRSTVIDAIQTDAAINPGNSGGPLVNLKGQVVGINSAIASLGSGVGQQSGNIGLGFAIPIDQARPIAQQLAADGSAQHAQLGVQVTDAENDSGAAVTEIVPNSPAAKAGLRVGDVVTKLGDRPIDSADALVAAVRSQQPGDEVILTVERGGSTRTVTATLAAQASS